MSLFRVLMLAMLVGVPPALAVDPEEDEEIEEEEEGEELQEEDEVPPPARLEPARAEPTRPLAVPGPSSDPPLNTTRPGPERGRATTPRAPTPTMDGPAPPPAERLGHFDVGYRRLWFSRSNMPIGGRLGEQPHLVHAAGSVLLEKDVMLGGSFETTLDPRRGTAPFVLDVRIGWWEGLGQPAKRGPFLALPGTRMTYVGWRVIHDHYRGAGGEWAGESSSAGLLVGYAYSAPLGRLTVTTDSQFTLYLLGWKGRSELPIGLLNQRLSVGFDPLFIDVRFRSDPGTGEELSVGLSMQGLFGLNRREKAK